MKTRIKYISFIGCLVVSVSLSGQTASLTDPFSNESDVRENSNSIVVTLTGDTLISSVGTDNSFASAFLSGLTGRSDSWSNLTASLDASNITLSGQNTVATINIPAYSSYFIPSNDTVSLFISSLLLLGDTDISSSDEIIITNENPEISIGNTTVNETDVRNGFTFDITLSGDEWESTLTTTFTDSIDSDGTGWDTQVRDDLTASVINNSVVRVTVPATPSFDIESNEDITIDVSATNLQHTESGDFAVTGVLNVDANPVSVTASATFDGLDEGAIRSSTTYEIILVLNEDTWVSQIGQDEAINQDLLEGFSLSGSESANDLEDAILASDRGAANTSVSGNTVTITVPQISDYNIDLDATISITVPSSAMTNATSDVSASDFASLDRIDPYMTISTIPSTLSEPILDGAELLIELHEVTTDGGPYNRSNFDLSTSPTDITSDLTISSNGDITSPSSDSLRIVLSWSTSGNIDVQHFLGLTIDASEISGSENLVETPSVVIQSVIEPVVIDVTIPNAPAGIESVVTATITLETGISGTFTLEGGTIAGRTLSNLTKDPGDDAIYTAEFTITEGSTSYDASIPIPVTDLLLSNNGVNGPLYSANIIQSNDLIDAERPVVSIINIDNGDYLVGDKVVAVIDANESNLAFNQSQTLINNVPLSDPSVSISESGSGIYQLKYTVQDNDDDVSGTIPVTIVAIDLAGNESIPFSTVTGSPSTIDANLPEIVSVEVQYSGTAVPGQTVPLLITSTEVGLDLGDGTFVNQVPMSTGNFTDNNDNTYTLNYNVTANDREVSSGNLTATVVLTDNAGNISSQVNGLLNNTVEIITSGPVATISGGGEICAGDSATIFVNPTGRANFTITVQKDGLNFNVFGPVTGPFSFKVSPDNSSDYTLSDVTDGLGISGEVSGLASVIVNPLPAVSITSPPPNATDIPLGSVVDLAGEPTGGVFTGPGVETSTSRFHADIAGIDNSPHTIYYLYEIPETGCSEEDSVVVTIVSEKLTIQDLPSVICYNDTDVEISGTNLIDGNPGQFSLYYSSDFKRSTPLPGIIDHGDGTATIDPPLLAATTYIVRYEYTEQRISPIFPFTVTYYRHSVEEPFKLDRIDEIKFIRMPDAAICNNSLSVSMLTNLDRADADYSYTGSGVAGGPIEGFDFYPSVADLGPGQIKYLFISEDGCKDSAYYEIEVYDVPDVEFSPDEICMPVDGGEISFTNETNKTNLVESWTWNFGDINSGAENIYSTNVFESSVIHDFTEPDEFNISLVITTTDQCVETHEESVVFGDEPIADFRWESDCYVADKPVILVNESTTNQDFEPFIWNIYNEDSLVVSFTNEFKVDTSYNFPRLNTYYIELIALNDLGCSDTRYDTLKFKETVDFSEQDAHIMEFNTNDDRWSSVSRFLDSTSAWRYGTPDFNGFDPVAGDFAWYTKLKDNIEENSWIQSPCFDFRDLERPMVRMDVMRSFDFNRDGAVIQYTTDNGESWTTIGNIDEGINWYNSFNIKEEPGGGRDGDGSPIGWSGNELFKPDTSWVTVAHDLDAILGDTLVIFGVFYATDGASVVNNQGIAIDNVYIGERSKLALIEHFTNSGDAIAASSDDVVNTFVENNKLDVVSLQYHMSYPGQDPMNEYNPSPAAARSFYYGVNQVPFALMDGGPLSEYEFDFVEQNPNIVDMKKLTLEAPLFDIDLEYTVNNQAGVKRLTSKIDIRALKSQDYTTMVLYVAVIDDSVSFTSGTENSVYKNVVLDMLPNSAGTAINRSWGLFDEYQEVVHWYYNDYEDPEGLAVVAFLQDRNSGRIVQVASESNPVFPVQVKNSQVENIRVYPNPVSSELFILPGQETGRKVVVEVTDMTGRIVKSEMYPVADRLVLDVGELKEGSYILNLTGGDGQVLGRSVFIKFK